MKTQFLKDLGILEQETIDAIMAENGKDINAVKGNTATLEAEIAELKTQLNERDTQLTTLKESVKDNDKLTKKITELEEANNTAKTEYENKITSLQKNHAIESAVREAKAKNVKAAMALLDMEKITYVDGKLDGLTTQLDALAKGEDTSFLFGESKPAPAGTNLNNPPSNGGNSTPTSNSLTEAITKAWSKN